MTDRSPQPRQRTKARSLAISAFALAVPALAASASPDDATELAALRRTVDDLRARVTELEAALAKHPALRPQQGSQSRATGVNGTVATATRATGASSVTPPTQRPGTLEVDERAAERALERTLTAEGVLLLGPGQYDIEPYFAYARRVSQAPQLVIAQDGVAVRNLTDRTNQFDAGLRVRAGLPWDLQFELDVPYRWVDQSLVTPVDLRDSARADEHADSLGDVKIGLAATLLREKNWMPDLVGRITWDTDTGDPVAHGVPLNMGYNELRFGLTAMKRQDPLAFTAGVAYSTTFEKDNVKPGNQWDLVMGVSLASSPETTLSAAFVQSFVQETQVAGHSVPGSDQVGSMLLLGASSILGRRTLLLVSLGIGLTEDVPDYVVNLSLPMRF